MQGFNICGVVGSLVLTCRPINIWAGDALMSSKRVLLRFRKERYGSFQSALAFFSTSFIVCTPLSAILFDWAWSIIWNHCIRNSMSCKLWLQMVDDCCISCAWLRSRWSVVSDECYTRHGCSPFLWFAATFPVKRVLLLLCICSFQHPSDFHGCA